MRARSAVLFTIAGVLMLVAGPASALETKPTNPPADDPSATVVSPPPAPYIEAVRYAGGNGDQTPDPGERLQVFFSLRNPTGHNLNDVTGTMTVKTGGISVVDGRATWPDIAPGAVEWATDPFVIQIADSAARAIPCANILEVGPTRGAVTPVASDVAISSDGNTSSGGGSAPASAGSSAPGAAPSVVEPAPPASVEPAPSTPVEPAPDAPVPFEAIVAVHTTSASFDTGFGSGVACPLALGVSGGTSSGTTGRRQTKTAAPDVRPVAEDASRASTPSSLPFLIGVLVAAAGALVVRSRVTA